MIEYTDFFTRAVRVHTGDTLAFRLAPGTGGHTVALAADEIAARSTYPVAMPDSEDAVKAIGSGMPKIETGPGLLSITGGSTAGGGSIGSRLNSPPPCGLQQPCVFKGGTEVENTGVLFAGDPQTHQPAALDWKIQINAPAGKYTYFCYIHPGMAGTLNVVDAGQPATTQAQIDAQAAAQFAADRDAALAAEKAADVVQFTGGAPGIRTYQVLVGLSAADNHVAIDEMLPRQALNLVPGDRVEYVWQDAHEAHSVTFPTDDKRLPEPFGFDCGATFMSVPPPGPPAPGAAPFRPCVEPGAQAPEAIFDPGNVPAGTALVDPAQVLDSGILFGTVHGFQPTDPQWSVLVNGATPSGAYKYQCILHDWMHGTLSVSAGASVTAAPVQAPAQIPAQMPNTGAGNAAGWWGGLTLLGLLTVGLATAQFASRRS